MRFREASPISETARLTHKVNLSRYQLFPYSTAQQVSYRTPLFSALQCPWRHVISHYRNAEGWRCPAV